MTNREAIKVLNMVEAHGALDIEAKKKAIEALEQQDMRCEICKYFYDINRLFEYYCPNCDVKMEVVEQ